MVVKKGFSIFNLYLRLLTILPLKKTTPIFLFLLFINSFSGKAQTYFPFADSNAVWKVSWGTPYEYSVYHYELTDDTLIGLLILKK